MVEQPGNTLDPVTVMAQISARRVTTWTTLARLTDPDGWAQRLRADLEELRQSVQWLDDSWRPDGLILLDVLVRRADRRGVEDLADLADRNIEAAQPELGRIHADVDAFARMCIEERQAWDRGEEARAKELRVEQMPKLGPEVPLRRVAAELAEARLPAWSPVADVVMAYLRLETGR